MISRQAQASADLFADFIRQRTKTGDWSVYLAGGGARLSRQLIAEACGFGRSVFVQNRAVLAMLRDAEERLSRAGVLGKAKAEVRDVAVEELQAEVELHMEKTAGLLAGATAELEALQSDCSAYDDQLTRLTGQAWPR